MTVALYEPEQRFNERWGEPAYYAPIRYRPPRDTMDPRYAACRRHWVACDCREAHMAEDRAELRAYAAENRRFEEAIDAVLALHGGPTVSGRCSDPACFALYPCPTRNLLAPLSWRERMNTTRETS